MIPIIVSHYIAKNQPFAMFVLLYLRKKERKGASTVSLFSTEKKNKENNED